MKLIKLTQGQFAQVDDEDFEHLNQWKWFALKGRSTFYAVKMSKWENGKRHYIWMHRYIMDTPKELEVDHKDHNGLNNQKDNLRNCTMQQNKINKKTFGKSIYKGVVCRLKGGYVVQICNNGNKKYLGVFDNEIEAAKAYDKAAKEIHGEFACLNFK